MFDEWRVAGRGNVNRILSSLRSIAIGVQPAEREDCVQYFYS